jgi:hypothetical protein
MAFPATTCTEQDLNELTNCLQCVSGDDLTAFQVYLLLQLTGLAVTPQAVQEVMCVNCHSDLDLQRMETAIWAELLSSSRGGVAWSAQSLRNATNCFKCLDPHTLRAARVLLLCQYLRSLLQ